MRTRASGAVDPDGVLCGRGDRDGCFFFIFAGLRDGVTVMRQTGIPFPFYFLSLTWMRDPGWRLLSAIPARFASTRSSFFSSLLSFPASFHRK